MLVLTGLEWTSSINFFVARAVASSLGDRSTPEGQESLRNSRMSVVSMFLRTNAVKLQESMASLSVFILIKAAAESFSKRALPISKFDKA